MGTASLGSGHLEDSGAGRAFQTEGAASTETWRKPGLPRHSKEFGLALGRKRRLLGPVMRGLGGAWAFHRTLA